MYMAGSESNSITRNSINTIRQALRVTLVVYMSDRLYVLAILSRHVSTESVGGCFPDPKCPIL